MSEMQLRNGWRADLAALSDYVRSWRDHFEMVGTLSDIRDRDDQETAWQLENLLERAMESWKV